MESKQINFHPRAARGSDTHDPFARCRRRRRLRFKHRTDPRDRRRMPVDDALEASNDVVYPQREPSSVVAFRVLMLITNASST
jgi:hypothetical protein